MVKIKFMTVCSDCEEILKKDFPQAKDLHVIATGECVVCGKFIEEGKVFRLIG